MIYGYAHGDLDPARGSTQVLLCLFPGVLLLWHFLYSVGPHPVSSLHIYTSVVSGAFMAGVASQAGDAESSWAPDLTSGLQGSMNVHRCAYGWCHSDNASVLLYFTFYLFSIFSSNLVNMLPMKTEWVLLIFKFIGQDHNRQISITFVNMMESKELKIIFVLPAKHSVT